MSLIHWARLGWKLWRQDRAKLRLLNRHARISYSQEGEDLLLLRLFERAPPGIYVDVGAHHPFRFSNTCLLHLQGWRGINIDALPGSMSVFRAARPRDICLETAVSDHAGTLSYHMFTEPALNTFDGLLAAEREASGWPRSGQIHMPCVPLAEILQRELPRLGADTVDVLSVDVEGFDLSVLRSNDWSLFRPRVLLVEAIDNDLGSLNFSELNQYCEGLGYRLFSKLVHSVIYVDDARRDAPDAKGSP
jgi:FkbM family methyltransferase